MFATPPRLNQENKENDRLLATPLRKIEWGTPKVFEYSPESDCLFGPSQTGGPYKSILKPSRLVEPFTEDKKREETPLPDDALSNARFLEWPVSTIIAEGSTLRNLTEAYNILAARIRSAVPPQFWENEKDGHYPLFDPLRLHREELSIAIIRDLGCVFIDPFDMCSSSFSDSGSDEHCSSSSSISSSPIKGGMSEEQVKYARDLSTATTSTIKFLSLAFQSPTIYNIFTTKQIDSMLDAVLAIPMAESLRSPSARKIYGFVMALIQTQRLPEANLQKAALNIIFALRRAIEGEFGREGKKGAIGEALKAVHDLSVIQPKIFIPHIASIFSSVLESLLAPLPGLRVQAAHAVGGFVIGITSSEQDFDHVHTLISPTVVDFFLRKNPLTEEQNTIFRVLRATLCNEEPTHHATGPFWALSVMTSFIILIGRSIMTDMVISVKIRSLIDCGMRSKKRPIRTLTAALWGPLIWVWHKWQCDIEKLEEEEDGGETHSKKLEAVARYSQLLMIISHHRIGVAYIGALLGNSHKSCSTHALFTALSVLRAAGNCGEDATKRTLEVLDRLLNGQEDSDFSTKWDKAFYNRLIPTRLLSVSPGLLTTDFTLLVSPLEHIAKQFPGMEDIRPFSPEEKRMTVWARIKDVWLICLESLEIADGESIPDLILDIWSGLVRMGVAAFRGQITGVNNFSERCADVLIAILSNGSLDLSESTKKPSDKNIADDGDGSSPLAMKLRLVMVRSLWSAACTILPASARKLTVRKLLRTLIGDYANLVPSDDPEGVVMNEWSQLCSQIATECDETEVAKFWENENEFDWDLQRRSSAWRGFARGWSEDCRGSWRGAAIILSLPFKSSMEWDMSDADLSTWNTLLLYTVERALEEDTTIDIVLDQITEGISLQYSTKLASTLRIADFLLVALEGQIERCDSLPQQTLDFINETLLAFYPPGPSNKIVGVWVLRSLQDLVSKCQGTSIVSLLESVNDGLCVWIADDAGVYNNDDYSRDVLPLYQAVLSSLEFSNPTVKVLQSVHSFFSSALQPGKISDRHEAIVSFKEFWENKCSKLTKPRAGWQNGIVQALSIAFGASLENKPMKNKAKTDKSLESITQNSDAIDDIDELDVLPRTSTPRRHLVNPIRASYSFTVTPKKVSKAAAMRPKKSIIPRQSQLDTPPSPSRTTSNGVSRRVRMRTSSGSQLVPTGDSAEKENLRPMGFSSLKDSETTVLGKRKEDNALVATPPSNKRKRFTSENMKNNLAVFQARDDMLGSDDSEADCAVVEASILLVDDTNSAAVDDIITEDDNDPFLVASSSTLPTSNPLKRRRTDDDVDAVIKKSKVYKRVDDDDCIPSDTDNSSSPLPVTPGEKNSFSGMKTRAVGIVDHTDPPSDDSIPSSPVKTSVRRTYSRLHPSQRLRK